MRCPERLYRLPPRKSSSAVAAVRSLRIPSDHSAVETRGLASKSVLPNHLPISEIRPTVNSRMSTSAPAGTSPEPRETCLKSLGIYRISAPRTHCGIRAVRSWILPAAERTSSVCPARTAPDSPTISPGELGRSIRAIRWISAREAAMRCTSIPCKTGHFRKYHYQHRRGTRPLHLLRRCR